MSTAFSKQKWAVDLLNNLGNTNPVPPLIDFIWAWERMESGDGDSTGANYNPLNTEIRIAGSTNFNSAGVQNYQSYQQGIDATMATLSDGHYPDLLKMLQQNDVTAISSGAIANNLSIWATGKSIPLDTTYVGTILQIFLELSGTPQGGTPTVSVDYPGAIDMIITNPDTVFTNALLSVANSDITIINHKTACGAPCTATSVAKGFGQPPEFKSTHFIVGRDGSVIQCVLLKDGAGGNCCTSPGYNSNYYNPLFAKYGQNANLFTISIEHEDWTTDNSQPMTTAQINASNALNLWLVERYGISTLNIHSHASLDPVNRARCPGSSFDFNQLFNYINQRIHPVTPPNPNQIAAFNLEWVSEQPTVSLASGIAVQALADYVAGKFHGPATSLEYPDKDWNGNDVTAQNVHMGTYHWDGSTATYYPYH